MNHREAKIEAYRKVDWHIDDQTGWHGTGPRLDTIDIYDRQAHRFMKGPPEHLH